MKVLNVIVSGPQTAEKRTFIEMLSDQTFQSPEQVAAGKDGDLYHVDFGRLEVAKEYYLYLAGIPIDEQFSFLWERLAEGLLGFVVITDPKDSNQAAATKDLIERLKKLIDVPLVVGFYGLGDPGKDEVSGLRKSLGISREDQVVCFDAEDRESAKKVLIRLFSHGAKLSKRLSA